MSKVLNLTFTVVKDRYGEEYGHQVTGNAGDEVISFSAYDLCEYPEDATLYRDLFNGCDYIEALELGMKLASMGYDSIEVEEIEKD